MGDKGQELRFTLRAVSSTQPGAGESSHHARLSAIGAGQEQHVSGSSPAPPHGQSNNGVPSEQPGV